MADDPVPARTRRRRCCGGFPRYLRLSWRLAREPLLSRARRAAVIVAAAGYLASPVDLVPGVIPVLGQLDDIAVALAAIRVALAGLSPERRRRHLDAVGLTDDDLTADLRTVGAATAWVLRAGARTTGRGARAGRRGARGRRHRGPRLAHHRGKGGRRIPCDRDEGGPGLEGDRGRWRRRRPIAAAQADPRRPRHRIGSPAAAARQRRMCSRWSARAPHAPRTTRTTRRPRPHDGRVHRSRSRAGGRAPAHLLPGGAPGCAAGHRHRRRLVAKVRAGTPRGPPTGDRSPRDLDRPPRPMPPAPRCAVRPHTRRRTRRALRR